MDITNDAKKLLFLIYKNYLKQRKNGVAKADAINIGGAERIQKDLMPEESVQDVDSFLKELDSSGYLDVHSYDNLARICFLTNYAIAVLENYPKETFKSVTSFIAQFIP